MMKWCCRVLGGWNRPAFTSNSWIHSEKEKERERENFDRPRFICHPFPASGLKACKFPTSFPTLHPWEVRIAEFSNALLRLPAVFWRTFEASSATEAFHPDGLSVQLRTLL